jgi:hypothetical protein
MNLATINGEKEKFVLYRSVQRNKKAETTMTRKYFSAPN